MLCLAKCLSSTNEKKIVKQFMGESNHSNYKLKNFKLLTSSSWAYFNILSRPDKTELSH